MKQGQQNSWYKFLIGNGIKLKQSFVCYICVDERMPTEEMNIDYKNMNADQRGVAIQRLTALWAFTESGLGGIMHALQIPFTGLLVGGMAIVIICLIAEISNHNYKFILKAALIVLIVKAMVSPHTPFPAYIAVSFQALMGYALFSLFKVNFISILFLSLIAMLESAIQKLLILTLFFGESIWKALDSMLLLLTKQFGIVTSNGSFWIIGIYLFIYLIGGFIVGWLAYRSIQSLYTSKPVFILVSNSSVQINEAEEVKSKSMRSFKKLALLFVLMLVISIVLFFVATDRNQGWVSVIKTISWTLSALFVWYMIIGPIVTKLIQRILQKKETKYSEEVLKTLSFLPVLKQLAALAWQQSKEHKGLQRWNLFVGLLIHGSLTYSEVDAQLKPKL